MLWLYFQIQIFTGDKTKQIFTVHLFAGVRMLMLPQANEGQLPHTL